MSYAHAAQIEILPRADYAETRDISLLILEMCPPATCMIVTLGRSPTLFGVILNLLHPGSAVILPLGKFRHRLGNVDPRDAFARRYPRSLKPLGSHEENYLFKHFDHFIPDAVALGGRDLMVIDYSETGHSVVAAGEYLKRFMRVRGRASQIRSLAITTPGKRQTVLASTSDSQVPLSTIELSPRSGVAHALARGQYDPYSPYRSYILTPVRNYYPPPSFPDRVNVLIHPARAFIQDDPEIGLKPLELKIAGAHARRRSMIQRLLQGIGIGRSHPTGPSGSADVVDCLGPKL